MSREEDEEEEEEWDRFLMEGRGGGRGGGREGGRRGVSREGRAKLWTSKAREEEEGSECNICMSSITTSSMVTRLPCGREGGREGGREEGGQVKSHLFHAGCVGRWMETHKSCPNCRWPIEG